MNKNIVLAVARRDLRSWFGNPTGLAGGMPAVVTVVPLQCNWNGAGQPGGGLLHVGPLLPTKLVQLGTLTSKLSLGQRPIGGRAGKIP